MRNSIQRFAKIIAVLTLCLALPSLSAAQQDNKSDQAAESKCQESREKDKKRIRLIYRSRSGGSPQANFRRARD